MSTSKKGPQRPANESSSVKDFEGVRIEMGPDVVNKFRDISQQYATMADRFIEALGSGKFSSGQPGQGEQVAQPPIQPPAEYLNVEVHLNLRDGVVHIVPVQAQPQNPFGLGDLGRFS